MCVHEKLELLKEKADEAEDFREMTVVWIGVVVSTVSEERGHEWSDGWDSSSDSIQ